MFNKYIRAMKYIRRGHRGQEGMTGLETAIILIAFVTVAAVFGYAVLSAGLFSAERGKETVYAGLDQAKSNLELSGSVIASGNGTGEGATVSDIRFTVKNSIAGRPIDMTPNSGDSAGKNRLVVSVRTASEYHNNVKWTYTAIGQTDNDNILEPGEQFEVVLDMATILTTQLKHNDSFAIQLKPEIGSSTTIERRLPASIDTVMDLY